MKVLLRHKGSAEKMPSSDTKIEANSGQKHPQQNFLQLDRLNKGYTEGGEYRTILRDTSISFPKGEFAAILGKSGSGKTTLLNLISGIDRVESGDIYLDGICLTGLNDLQRTLFRRQHIGFIFQFFNLIPTLTVWENVTLPLELNGTFNDAGKAHAQALLEEVGLGSRSRAFPDRISGGEQQRVSIARALVHDPQLVLADEPTGNLDEETGKTIMDLLDRLTRRAGKNMILVTHSPEAAFYADRVFNLHEGRLVEKRSS
jgi:putative ABC transport system ATP-binding protein